MEERTVKLSKEEILTIISNIEFANDHYPGSHEEDDIIIDKLQATLDMVDFPNKQTLVEYLNSYFNTNVISLFELMNLFNGDSAKIGNLILAIGRYSIDQEMDKTIAELAKTIKNPHFEEE